MQVQRWDGAQLVNVNEQEIARFARETLYIPCGKPGCTHGWTYAGPNPVPSSQALKNLINRDVPHMTASSP